MKKVLSLFIINIILMTSFACAMDFSDVMENHSWATAAIEELADSEIISGYPDGTFKPDNNITNAETAKLLTLIFGKSDTRTEYNDTIEKSWYYEYVSFSGDYFLREENFYPENKALRKEIAYAVYMASDMYKNDESYKNELSDEEKYEKALTYLKNKEILKGYPDGSLGGEKNVTRAEFAVIIKRVADLEFIDEEKPSAYPRPHSYFFLVTEIMISVADDGEPRKKICGYINGEYEENFLYDNSEVMDLNGNPAEIKVNEVIYIFKDYFGKIMYVVPISDAEILKFAEKYYDFNIYNSNQTYVFGKIERVRNGKILEFIEKIQDGEKITEGYRINAEADYYVYENGEISLGRLSRIKEDRISGKGDYVFAFLKKEEVTDVLIIKK